MSHEITFSPWAEQWLDRTHKGLTNESVIFICGLASVGLVASIAASVAVFKLRRALKNSPSDRAALFAKADKRMLQATKCHFYLSILYLIHALGIWVVDAAIGVFAIAQDVNASPEDYNTQVWLDLAIHSVGMLGIFAAVFVLFPAAQMTVAGYFIGRAHKNNADGTLAIYVPAFRQLSTHMAHLWSMIGFLVMIWWPVFERTTMRLIILEAVFGSTMAWLHASYIFNFRAEQLEQVEVQPLLSVRDGVKMYGQQIYAAHSGKSAAGLPQYEAAAQTEPLLNEKSGQ